MGGTSSVAKYFHLSEEEVKGQERTRALQEMVQAWVGRSIFYAVPIRSRRKTRAVDSAIWIEPVPEAIEQSLIAKASGGQVNANEMNSWVAHSILFIIILLIFLRRIHWRRCPQVFSLTLNVE